MSIKETLSEKAQVPVTKKHRFGMLPEDVMRRKDLTAGEKLVLQAMNMESFGTGYVAASDSVLAELSGLSRARMVDIRRSLENLRLIEKDGAPIKQVQPYRLLHVDMQGNNRDALITKTNRSERVPVKLGLCVLCKDPCVPSRRTGWCRKCSADARNRVITKNLVREEVRSAVGQWKRESA